MDFEDLLTFVVGESFVPRRRMAKQETESSEERSYSNKSHWYACVMEQDSEVMVEVVQLTIEENSMEKNPDEKVPMLLTCYLV